MKAGRDVEIAVIGAGIAGIATAYYLCVAHKRSSILLIDSRQPMSFTSAQSGDNYRNWWPHPTMVDFTNDSIDLMETIAEQTSNVINMTRRGYVLATRRTNIDDLIEELGASYGNDGSIRMHDSSLTTSYKPALSADWTTAEDGVDILTTGEKIRQAFPTFDPSVANVIHIRRGGDFSGQQMGQYMLEQIKLAGGKRLAAEVRGIENTQGFVLDVVGPAGSAQIRADVVVNAAGPFANRLAGMMDLELPIENVFQQKIAFEDSQGAVPRRAPFSIDLDEKELDWTQEEREWLASEPDMAWLAKKIAGGTHCRPEGGDDGKWVKLGWAYNDALSEPQQDLVDEPRYDPHFPEIVMRGAAVLQPALQAYTHDFPNRWTHYGGYYSMTRENWPLIGPLGRDGAFVVGALSGFGSMAACAAGSLAARQILGKSLPGYAAQLSLARYNDKKLMADIASAHNKGVL